jgi:hypothetical protein
MARRMHDESEASSPLVVLGALTGFAVSAVALGLAPLLMPDDYSWVARTTSESAAQGVSGAWLARSGLLLFGLSVIAVAQLRAREWPPIARWLHVGFGSLLTATAAFSTRPWRADTPFDRTEDALHSVAATAMGFAFALGVAAVLVLRPRDGGTIRQVIGGAAVLAAVALPAAMWMWPDAQGVLQRSMFLIAYLWCITEALRSYRR